jgi:hypothetical protein
VAQRCLRRRTLGRDEALLRPRLGPALPRRAPRHQQRRVRRPPQRPRRLERADSARADPRAARRRAPRPDPFLPRRTPSGAPTEPSCTQRSLARDRPWRGWPPGPPLAGPRGHRFHRRPRPACRIRGPGRRCPVSPGSSKWARRLPRRCSRKRRRAAPSKASPRSASRRTLPHTTLRLRRSRAPPDPSL